MGEPLPTYPRPRSHRPIHRVNRRTTILMCRQAVTQAAAPPPPALSRRTQKPRGPGMKSTVDLECLLARDSSTLVPSHLNRAGLLPGQRDAKAYTLTAHPPLSVCENAVPPLPA